MRTKIFVKDESGAVTVDWVVLTGTVIGLSIATFAAISTTMQNATTANNEILGSGLIQTSFD